MLDEILDLEPLEWPEQERFLFDPNQDPYLIFGFCVFEYKDQDGMIFSCCQKPSHKGQCAWYRRRRRESWNKGRELISHGWPIQTKVEDSQTAH